MKRFSITLIGLSLLCSDLQADDTLRGGLIGAAMGGLVGHHSSNIDTAIAVPAFAAAGALIGSASDDDWHVSSGYGWGYDCGYGRGRDYRYGRYPRRHNYHSSHFRYHHSRSRPYRDARPQRRNAKTASKEPRPDPHPAANLHPGVTITHISVPMANGILLDFRILQVNGRFIGPNGDAFDDMPSVDTLARRYLPQKLRLAPDAHGATSVRPQIRDS
jgi:hypothetical protein